MMNCTRYAALAALVSLELIAAPALGQTASVASLRAEVTAAGQAEVTRRLHNPADARFRNIVIYDVAHRGINFTVCGEVNARDATGAYTGFRRFSVDGLGRYNGRVGGGSANIEDPAEPMWHAFVDAACGKDSLHPEWRL